MSFTKLIEADAITPDMLIVDCSFDLGDPGAGRRAFAQGHIPGAHYLHLDADLSGPPSGTNGRHPLPDPEVFAATMRGIGLHNGQQVMAYDAQGGPYAARLWWLLRWAGHDKVAVLNGGLQAWTGPLESGTGDAAPGDFVAKGPALATVDADTVLANIAAPKFLVVDARTPERWRGEANPLDPVAGHIPGSANRFFKDNLLPDGRFKPAEQLAAEWGAVLGDAAPADSVMQCGSGVTACHNLLAMEVADLGGARLYPGSWSEWIADPERPVAREI
ncbi:sulfurtransferase [Sphingomonas crocodyli]|uniref:Sulfurtransferase n=1 Tax=Sphingomonas crocodyli TaxID=1979270 RepID=A0A437M5K3_9SPHN|nr:sulfurtransferase [Sphingomonas crocodyli]RVT92754.1 sulfurtransferase [Sphingomonas crocodyli]